MQNNDGISFDSLDELHPIVIYNKIYYTDYLKELVPYTWWVKYNWPDIKAYKESK